MRLSRSAIRSDCSLWAKCPPRGAQDAVERLLAGVTEGRVTGVVAEPDRLDEILVERERPRDDARDGGRLERVGHPRPVVVACGIDEDLRLALEPPEGLRVDDPVAVALERRSQAALRLRLDPPARPVGLHGVGRERLLLERTDSLGEGVGDEGFGARPPAQRIAAADHRRAVRRGQRMIGTVPPSTLQAAPVT